MLLGICLPPCSLCSCGHCPPTAHRLPDGGVASKQVLCASSEAAVAPLAVPQGVPNGERVMVAGADGDAEPQINPKKKILEALFPDMATDAGVCSVRVHRVCATLHNYCILRAHAHTCVSLQDVLHPCAPCTAEAAFPGFAPSPSWFVRACHHSHRCSGGSSVQGCPFFDVQRASSLHHQRRACPVAATSSIAITVSVNARPCSR
jgi:hypothetical protein